MQRHGDETRPQDCGSFERCDATLCPLGAAVGWLESAVWFPGEAICARQGRKPRWVAVQRRIERAVGGDPRRGYFTVRMLEALTKVSRTMQGLPVDVPDEAAAEAAWCGKRKRQDATPEQAERRREHGRRLAAARLASRGTSSLEKRAECTCSSEVAGQIGISGHVEGADVAEADSRGSGSA